jgi:hypothetical protein
MWHGLVAAVLWNLLNLLDKSILDIHINYNNAVDKGVYCHPACRQCLKHTRVKIWRDILNTNLNISKQQSTP